MNADTVGYGTDTNAYDMATKTDAVGYGTDANAYEMASAKKKVAPAVKLRKKQLVDPTASTDAGAASDADESARAGAADPADDELAAGGPLAVGYDADPAQYELATNFPDKPARRTHKMVPSCTGVGVPANLGGDANAGAGADAGFETVGYGTDTAAYEMATSAPAKPPRTKPKHAATSEVIKGPTESLKLDGSFLVQVRGTAIGAWSPMPRYV